MTTWVDKATNLWDVIKHIPRIGLNRGYRFIHANLPAWAPHLPQWMQSWFEFGPMCPHEGDFVCWETNGLHRLDAVLSDEAMEVLDTCAVDPWRCVGVAAAGVGALAVAYGLYRWCTRKPPRRILTADELTQAHFQTAGAGNHVGGRTQDQMLQAHGTQRDIHAAAAERRNPHLKKKQVARGPTDSEHDPETQAQIGIWINEGGGSARNFKQGQRSKKK